MTKNKNENIKNDSKFMSALSKIDSKYIEDIVDDSVQPITVTAPAKKSRLLKIALPTAAALAVTAAAITGITLSIGNLPASNGTDIILTGGASSSDSTTQAAEAAESSESSESSAVTEGESAYHNEILRKFDNYTKLFEYLDKSLDFTQIEDYDEHKESFVTFKESDEGQIGWAGTMYIAEEDNAELLYKKGDLVFDLLVTYDGENRVPKHSYLICGNVADYSDDFIKEAGLATGKETEVYVEITSIYLTYDESGIPLAQCTVSSIIPRS